MAEKNDKSFFQNRKTLFISLGFTLFWGLIAHAYGLLNGIFSHDSLNALIVSPREELWKLELGRFMVPGYRFLIRKGFAVPWLIGLLGFAYIGVSVYLITKIFRIHSVCAVFLTAGFCTTNLTVLAVIGTYIYEFDVDMFAFLLSITAVFFWRKDYKKGWLLGGILIALSAGFYQAYISVAVTSIMICCMVDLLNKEKIKDVIIKGISGILMLIYGGGVYFLLLKLIMIFGKIELTNTENGLTNLLSRNESICNITRNAFFYWVQKSTRLIPAYSHFTEKWLNIVLFSAAILVVLRIIWKRKISLLSAFIILLIGVLMPVGINSVYIISDGMIHDLMIFSYAFNYILVAILILDIDLAGTYSRIIRSVCSILLSVLLFGNIQSSNSLYLKKDLEKQSTLSVMTRVVDKIESYPEYVKGYTPVAIFGKYDQDTMKGFEEYESITGNNISLATSDYHPTDYFNTYNAYLSYILNSGTIICSPDTWYRLEQSEILRQMPVFPKDGCVQIIDGVLVVKMNNHY